METIKGVLESVKTILGPLRIVPGKFVPSIFNYVLNNGSSFLVYNTFTRSLISLDSNEIAPLKDGIHVVEADSLPMELRSLIEDRFFVHSDYDETEIYKSIFDIINDYDYSDYVNNYTILTTTGCNARCFYCFEADFKPISMLPETAKSVGEYIIAHCNGKHVFLHWFGGEPLCNTPAIDIISQTLFEAGVSFTSSITSNGLLFNDTIIDKAKHLWNLTSAQVTLDGYSEEHNRRKNFKGNCDDPFKSILTNIQKLLDTEILVNIRINFDKQNIPSVDALIDYLISKFEGNIRVSVSPTILYENCSAWNAERKEGEQEFLRSKLVKYRDILETSSLYRKRKVTYKFLKNYCGANGKHFLTINPDGRFSVCHNYSDQCTYGSVFDGIDNSELYDSWKKVSSIRPKCQKCKWLPDCTPYAMCPIKKSDCYEEREDITTRQMLGEYKKWKSKKDTE